MTAYVDCKECGDPVPWYYAWLYGPVTMHPGCALERIDEEGCGAVWFELSSNSDWVFHETGFSNFPRTAQEPKT